MATKYNGKTENHEPYKVPKGAKYQGAGYKSWILTKYIKCANCGEKLNKWDAYTSTEIFTDEGYVYLVCERCRNAETRKDSDSVIKLIRRDEVILDGWEHLKLSLHNEILLTDITGTTMEDVGYKKALQKVLEEMESIENGKD